MKRPIAVPAVTGMTHAYMKLPRRLHEAMKALYLVRQEIDGDVHLWTLYREAVERYLASKPQQQMLNGRKMRKTA